MVTCADVSFAAVAVFATVDAGFAASFSRTRRAFGSAITLKMSVIICFFLTRLPEPERLRLLQ